MTNKPMNTTPQHFRPEDGIVRKISESYSVLNLLTAQQSEQISLAIGTAIDHEETTQTSSERVYFVLEGEIIVNDEMIIKVGEVVYIPANIEYRFKGSFKAIIINSPAFRAGNEKKSAV
jgi:mannose-6-phosphate isomerase-like protein (cupin superfamily)